MKVLKRYTVFTILKIGFLTSMLAGLMLMGVDLFKNLDTYTTYQVPGVIIFRLTLLYFPEGFLLGLGPSFLFAITYFLSQFHASNEFICVLNSGVKYGKFLRPCFITGIIVTCFFFAFNETVAIRFSNAKEALFKEVTYDSEGENDNSNIALSDAQNGYLVYADEYIDSSNVLYNVTYIEKDNNGKLLSRMNGYKAIWNSDNKDWIIFDAYKYTPEIIENRTKIEHYDEIEVSEFNLEPQLFRNLSAQVSKMSLGLALDYIKRIKTLNPVQYASMATEFYKRVLTCITPLVMIVIACSLNYKLKKNVMFFSLICSICIAVVYYVIQMVTIMLADQGVILPALGMIIPFVAILILTGLLSLIIRN